MTTAVHKATGVGLMIGLGTIFGYAFQDLLNRGSIASDAPEIVVTAWDLMPFLLPFGIFFMVAVALWRW